MAHRRKWAWSGWRGGSSSTDSRSLHPGVSKAELNLILSDPVEKFNPCPGAVSLPIKETWALRDHGLASFLPTRSGGSSIFSGCRVTCRTTFGLSLSANRLPLVVVYSISTVGSIGGGWLSSTLLEAAKRN